MKSWSNPASEVTWYSIPRHERASAQTWQCKAEALQRELLSANLGAANRLAAARVAAGHQAEATRLAMAEAAQQLAQAVRDKTAAEVRRASAWQRCAHPPSLSGTGCEGTKQTGRCTKQHTDRLVGLS